MKTYTRKLIRHEKSPEKAVAYPLVIDVQVMFPRVFVEPYSIIFLEKGDKCRVFSYPDVYL